MRSLIAATVAIALGASSALAAGDSGALAPGKPALTEMVGNST